MFCTLHCHIKNEFLLFLPSSIHPDIHLMKNFVLVFHFICLRTTRKTCLAIVVIILRILLTIFFFLMLLLSFAIYVHSIMLSRLWNEKNMKKRRNSMKMFNKHANLFFYWLFVRFLFEGRFL